MPYPLASESETSLRERWPSSFCIRCGYNLRGLAIPRCPECGRLFDPEDGTSFTVRPLSRAARMLLHTPRWPVLLFAGVAVLCWLASYCMPGRWMAACLASTGAWAFVFLLIPARFVAFRILEERYFLWQGRKLSFRPWVIAAGILAAMLAFNWSRLPARLAFSLSRSQFDPVARSLYSSEGTIGPGWLGLYRVERASLWQAELGRAQKRGGGTFKARAVCFEFGDQIEDVWLVYCPDGDPADLPRDVRDCFTPLGGGWYEWHEGPTIFPSEN